MENHFFFSVGKTTISMVIFNSYVCLPGGILYFWRTTHTHVYLYIYIHICPSFTLRKANFRILGPAVFADHRKLLQRPAFQHAEVSLWECDPGNVIPDVTLPSGKHRKSIWGVRHGGSKSYIWQSPSSSSKTLSMVHFQ